MKHRLQITQTTAMKHRPQITQITEMKHRPQVTQITEMNDGGSELISSMPGVLTIGSNSVLISATSATSADRPARVDK